MSDLTAFKAFGKGAQKQAVKGTNAVIYTRVSTRDQVDNLSLSTQRKYCIEYAQRNGYTVLRNFGGTHESASNDERAEFKAMIEFVKKSKDKVSFIICYSYDRFSRNENSFWLTSKLRALNIEILSTTQNVDTSNPAGQMQQRLYYVFNQFENELRREKTSAGMKEALLRGQWVTSLPIGYISKKIGTKRTVEIDAKGEILRHAFVWRAEGMTYDAIRLRLATKGITLCKQRVAAILQNPFYCGLLSHKMLHGQVVKGNHEPLVSQDLFLKVNGLLLGNHRGYTVKGENEQLPLKCFLKCEKCGQHLHGYVVNKKGIHYYKCSTKGCGTNRNAEVLNQRFAEILEWFRLDLGSGVVQLIRQQAVATNCRQFSCKHA